MWQKIKEWYRGKYVPPRKNDPNSPVVFIGLGHYEQPPLAKALGRLARFWLERWPWIITTLIALVATLRL